MSTCNSQAEFFDRPQQTDMGDCCRNNICASENATSGNTSSARGSPPNGIDVGGKISSEAFRERRSHHSGASGRASHFHGGAAKNHLKSRKATCFAVHCDPPAGDRQSARNAPVRQRKQTRRHKPHRPDRLATALSPRSLRRSPSQRSPSLLPPLWPVQSVRSARQCDVNHAKRFFLRVWG